MAVARYGTIYTLRMNTFFDLFCKYYLPWDGYQQIVANAWDLRDL